MHPTRGSLAKVHGGPVHWFMHYTTKVQGLCVVRILWDQPERLANLKKHGLDFSIVSLAFLNEAIVRQAKGGRLQAIGTIDGTPVSLVFTGRGDEAISIISLRPASKKGAAMTKRDLTSSNGNARDDEENPEWSEADIRKGLSLSDLNPALAERIAAVIGRPARPAVKPAISPNTDKFRKDI